MGRAGPVCRFPVFVGVGLADVAELAGMAGVVTPVIGIDAEAAEAAEVAETDPEGDELVGTDPVGDGERVADGEALGLGRIVAGE